MKSQDKTSQLPLIILMLMPLVLLALAAAWVVTSDPLRVFNANTPPIENLTFERVYLDDTGIHMKLRAEGSEPMVIAQVQVDDAYWRFIQTPAGPIARLNSVWIDIAYPWRAGDAHVIVLVSNSGATFEHEIEVALAAPSGQVGQLRSQAALGGFVGILPVSIGLLFFPLLVRLQKNGMRLVLSLTIGMLAFLLVDLLEDAFEFAHAAAAAFQGPVMVLMIAAVVCFGLIAIGRRDGTPSGLALATFIALGIGLHNFGEGLAIGAAIAAGATSLGAFLILGFTIHNVTEGIAIAAPLVRSRPPLLTFVGLALLAGAPAIAGIWLGSYAIAPQWAALALAIGAGAILQVIYEVGALVLRGKDNVMDNLDRYLLGGFTIGIAFMYLTGLAIKI